MNRREEFEAKVRRVRALLAEKSLGAAVLSRRSSFAWLTCGGQNHVAAASEIGAGSLVVTLGEVFLLSNNIENDRLLEEECQGLPISPAVFPWHLEAQAKPAALQAILKGCQHGSDGAFGGASLAEDLMHLRHPLLPPEVVRYRELGQEAAAVVQETCRDLRPGLTEFQVAGMLAKGCLDRGLDATVRLVAFDERISRYRHPIPTGRVLRKQALVVLGARRSGLIVSLSRMVSFASISPTLQHKHEAVCRVDAALNLASRPGRRLGDILREGISQYEAEGFGDEWRLHHQGGLTGYEGRDTRATLESAETIHSPTAVAWNPSITGTKSEDTFLVTEEGLENLTASAGWPVLQAGVARGSLDRWQILVV
jgi:Xaa-Pro aminopeptidase